MTRGLGMQGRLPRSGRGFFACRPSSVAHRPVARGWFGAQQSLDLTRHVAGPKLLRHDSHFADMIEIRDVSKSYGHFRALDGCTTSVAKGTVVVVCGPSGSGKSTLIRCVNGLEPVDGGTIVVDGVVVTAPHTNLVKLRSRIGMVFQSFE